MELTNEMKAQMLMHHVNPMAFPEGRLAKEYQRELVDRGIAERRRDLKKLDRIDVRSLYKTPPHPYDFPNSVPEVSMDLLRLYLLHTTGCESRLHCILPCFSEGSLLINKDLEVRWAVIGTDTEAQTEDVEFCVYADAGVGWSLIAKVRVRISAPKDGDELVRVFCGNYLRFEELSWDDGLRSWNAIHTAIPADELPWNEKDKALWRDFLSPDRLKKYEIYETGDTALFVTRWLSAIFAVNVLLWARTREKKKVESTGWNRTNTKPKAEAADPSDNVPKRVTRTVGGVVLTSEKAPRSVTSAGARHYKVAAWKRMGHPRHYKSGKVVWIKESTVHRKAVKLPDADALPVTIKAKSI